MSGAVILALDERTRIVDDRIQWVVERLRQNNERGWRGVSWCVTRRALRRVIAERGINLTAEAAAVIEALPPFHPEPGQYAPRPRRAQVTRPDTRSTPVAATESPTLANGVAGWAEQRRALPDIADAVPPSDPLDVGPLLLIPAYLDRRQPTARMIVGAPLATSEAA